MKILLFVASLLFVHLQILPQSLKKNAYGLYIIEDLQTYTSTVEKDSANKLVDLEKFIPGIKLDIRYASDNNFLGEKVYKEAKAYLRLPAAIQLKKIQHELKSKNLQLKIFDAYRPYEATVLFYEKVKDTVYAASAWTGSRHNRGCAVDLTIISTKPGVEIKMPTDFDDFTKKAHSNYSHLDKDVLRNSQILIDIMESHGFKNYSAEWWHYDFDGWRDYELMNLSFNELSMQE